MRTTNIIAGLAILVMVAGCSKEKENDENQPNLPVFDNKTIVTEVFNAGMASISAAQGGKYTYPFNYPVEDYYYGKEGGYIHLLGSISGSITVDDNTGSIVTGILLIGLTETINDYSYESEGQKYTLVGDPYISLAGTFTLASGGTSYGTASSMEIGGGVRVLGPGVDHTVNIQITIIINSSGSGGLVSGTIDGQGVYYTL